jgi:CBS domain-containing protein
MLVKDVMTKSPVCCKPGDKLDRIAKLMQERDCGVVPVCDGARVVGMITDRDITCRGVASGKPPAAIAVADVMTKTVFSIRDGQSAEAAIDLMKEKQVRRLPVLDEAGHLVGIVAPSDLAPLFASEHDADFLLAVSYWNRRKVVAA